MSCSQYPLLWIILLWTLVYTWLFKSLLCLLWGIFPEVKLLDHMVEYHILCSVFETSFQGHLFSPYGNQSINMASWAFLGIPVWWGKKCLGLCLHLVPEVTDHVTSFSCPNKKYGVYWIFQPDPCFNSTEAHWGLCLYAFFVYMLEIWAKYSHPAEYRNYGSREDLEMATTI